nr:hypothetical protein [Mycobacterium lepromatosis]
MPTSEQLDERKVLAGTVDITFLSAKPLIHTIRVHNYETNLSGFRIALADVLDLAGVVHVATEVTAIDTNANTVTTLNVRPTATADSC